MTDENQDIQEEAVEPVEEVEEQPTEEVQEEEASEISEYEKGKRFAEQGAKKSIAKEVSKRKRLEYELEQLKGYNDEIKAQNEEILSKLNQFNQLKAPRYEDFASSSDPDYEYQKAMYEHFNQPKESVKPKQPSQPKSDIDASLAQQFESKESVFANKNPDYIENRNNLIPFIQGNSQLINALHEAGPEVVNYLGENLDLADDISRMSPVQMGRMLAKIENQSKGAEPTRQLKRTSPPPEAPRGRSRAVKDISTMSQREYNAFMADPNNFN